MNDWTIADTIRRALDADVERLPERVTNRLVDARAAALSRISAESQRRPAPAVAPARDRRPVEADGPPPWIRRLTAPVAAVLFAGGLVGVWDWSDQRRARELAAIDVAILADDVPLAVYADKGFGVYIRNTRP
jgi:hypothetical protein